VGCKQGDKLPFEPVINKYRKGKPVKKPEPKRPLNDRDPVDDFFDEHERDQLANPHGRAANDMQVVRPWVIVVLVLAICLICFAIGWALGGKR
jgi:hypothetical protein